ncbi:cerebral dopamine neurotrophic factor [Ornithorhynchus anatinus]|uniref:cerebral dopamine neurotrophic factor n=1 Tax=Ornithorhynchus anatinus TaxID=9258 RepID=UPI000223E950|nr:cerebral dopamine neurotrophic factor [Ornithorhynchus anatinus]
MEKEGFGYHDFLLHFLLLVCREFLDRLYNSLLSKDIHFSGDVKEKELTDMCLVAKGKENHLCYYLGATSDAATKILSEVTHSMNAHIPAVKICEKLKRIDSQIREFKYERKLDLESVNLLRMRVAELKRILDSWGEACTACVEKADFVNVIKELTPKYAATSPRSEL